MLLLLSKAVSKQNDTNKNVKKKENLWWELIFILDFRGYTIRKKFGFDVEDKFKQLLNNFDNKLEAHKALLNEGVSNEDAALIVQRWYKTERKVRKKPLSKDPIHPKLRQADLIQFSQNVIKI